MPVISVDGIDGSEGIPGAIGGGGTGDGKAGTGCIGENKAGARCIPGVNPGSVGSWAGVNRCARVSGGLGAVFETARKLSEILEMPEALDSCDLDRDDLSDAVFRGLLGEPVRGGGGGLGVGLIVGV